MSAFVLPFKSNIVYITIMKSDYFGEIDFVVPAREHGLKVEEMVEQINTNNFNLTRQFTVQSIEDSTFLSINIKNL